MQDNRVSTKTIFSHTTKERRFYNEARIKITRSEARKQLEHQYSKNYQALKNHYYLIQIGHMIAQMLEAWEKLWRGIRPVNRNQPP